MHYRHLLFLLVTVAHASLIFPSEQEHKKEAESLLCAIAEHKFKQVVSLLRNKADVNSQDDLGMTPLMTAVFTNNYPLARLLKFYGANANKEAANGDTPLAMAITNNFHKGGSDDLVKLLCMHDGLTLPFTINHIIEHSTGQGAHGTLHYKDSISEQDAQRLMIRNKEMLKEAETTLLSPPAYKQLKEGENPPAYGKV